MSWGVSEELVPEVLAAGLCAVFPWLVDARSAECFVDAADRRDIALDDAPGLVELALEMSEADEVAL